jgi:hypothetical protein
VVLGEHDHQCRVIRGDVIDQHRVRVPQLDPPPAGQACSDAGLPGMEHDRQGQLGGRLIQRVAGWVVRHEILQRGVELEAPGPGGGQIAEAGDGRRAVVRVDGRERDQHVVVVSRRLRDDGFARQRRVPESRVGVHGDTTAAIWRSR